MFLSLLRLQDNIILPKWYEEATDFSFNYPQDAELHVPS